MERKKERLPRSCTPTDVSERRTLSGNARANLKVLKRATGQKSNSIMRPGCHGEAKENTCTFFFSAFTVLWFFSAQREQLLATHVRRHKNERLLRSAMNGFEMEFRFIPQDNGKKNKAKSLNRFPSRRLQHCALHSVPFFKKEFPSLVKVSFAPKDSSLLEPEDRKCHESKRSLEVSFTCNHSQKVNVLLFFKNKDVFLV